MKKKVLRVLDDQKIGGIKSTLEGFRISHLNDKFEFIVLPMHEAKSIVPELKPDIVIFHNACSWRRLPDLWLLEKYAKVIILEHHYSQEFERWQVTSIVRFRLMLRLAYGLADRVVAISQAQAEWMKKNRLVSPSKLTIISQCPNLDKLLVLPPKTPQKPLVLAAYGRFHLQKGFNTLIQAMRLVPQTNVELHLGGYGPDEAELKQLAQGFNNIKFLGAVRNVPEYLSSCDVVVIPSRWEPWGNVCLEAKAAGKPVIATHVDGLVEQVQDCGLLVPPEDPQSLAKAIEKFCVIPEESLQAWGQQGREAVKDAWNQYLTKWEKLLENILDD